MKKSVLICIQPSTKPVSTNIVLLGNLSEEEAYEIVNSFIDVLNTLSRLAPRTS